jgi:AAA15 family ATPase/GTPase
MDFELNGRRHQYGFAVTSAAVEDEWLHVFPKGKRQVWYSRQPWNKFAFGAKLKGENETIGALTRRNSLFLSAAAQNNHEQLLPVYRWFSDYVSVVTGSTEVRSHLEPFFWEPPSLEQLSKYLNKADLGIVGAKFDFLKLKLLHQVGSETIPFESGQESAGTLVYLNLLGPILQTLAVGGLLCIDELDASLHRLLIAEILTLFRASANTTVPAQLIFSAHNTNLITVLGRDQIWFTEKDNGGASQLYPLSDFKPRRQENLELGYVQGRYGGIPLIAPTLEGVDEADGAK